MDFDNAHNPKWRFFGEHLLADSKKPVAIVESEKAIISSAYFPELTWLATGSKSTLKPEYAHALSGRSVILFPDIGAYQEWKKRANDKSVKYFAQNT